MDRQVAARAQQRQTVEHRSSSNPQPSGFPVVNQCRTCLRERSPPCATGTREWRLSTGTDAVWAAVSHGDVIKAILADALGMHLDSFQRIVVDPASISIVRYTAARPYLITANSTTADLAAFLSPPRKRARSRRTKTSDDAVVGGLGAAEVPTERQAPGQVGALAHGDARN